MAGAAIAIAAGSGDKGGGGAGTAKHASTPATHREAKSKPKPRPRRLRPRPRRQPDHPGAGPDHPAGGDHPGPPAAQAKSDDAVALNNQGFALIGQGNAPGAVAPLQRSVEAFRAQERKGDIDYAYALYNLGNALRLSGRPADAIPYLQERLQISNYKRGIVKKELETAKQQAGQSRHGRGQDLLRSGEATFIQPTHASGGGRTRGSGRLS